MNKGLAVGVIVVCVQCKLAPVLVNQVGEIQGHDPFNWIGEWLVHFPQMAGHPCPGCGQVHDTSAVYLMQSCEIKPLEDPDQGIEQITDTPADEEITA